LLRELYLKDRLETLKNLKTTFSDTDVHVLSRSEEDEREAALRGERNARRLLEDELSALRPERDELHGKSHALELGLSSAIDRIERLEDELRHAQGTLAAAKEARVYPAHGVAPDLSAHARTSEKRFSDPREAAVPCEELPKRLYRRYPGAG
jgi:chromosome segregation ATPase